LIGARPGQKLVVNFRAGTLEETVHRAGRRLALGLIAAASMFAAGMTAVSTTVAPWVPQSFGVLATVLTLALLAGLMRRHRITR